MRYSVDRPVEFGLAERVDDARNKGSAMVRALGGGRYQRWMLTSDVCAGWMKSSRQSTAHRCSSTTPDCWERWELHQA